MEIREGGKYDNCHTHVALFNRARAGPGSRRSEDYLCVPGTVRLESNFGRCGVASPNDLAEHPFFDLSEVFTNGSGGDPDGAADVLE